MRTKHYHEALHHDSDRLVAYFGSARLVRFNRKLFLLNRLASA